MLTNSPLSVAKLFELSQIRTLSPTLCQLKPDPTFNCSGSTKLSDACLFYKFVLWQKTDSDLQYRKYCRILQEKNRGFVTSAERSEGLQCTLTLQCRSIEIGW